MSRRNYVQGETVHVVVRVALYETRIPVAVDSVRLTKMYLNGTAPNGLTPMDFTATEVGEYRLGIDSSAMPPGTYNIEVTVTQGTEIDLAYDSFLLEAP